MVLFDWCEFVDDYLHKVVYCDDGNANKLETMLSINVYAHLFCFSIVKYKGKLYEIPPVTYDEYVEAITLNINIEFDDGKKELDKYEMLKQTLIDKQSKIQTLYPIDVEIRAHYLKQLLIDGECVPSNEVMLGKTDSNHINHDLYIQLSTRPNVNPNDLAIKMLNDFKRLTVELQPTPNISIDKFNQLGKMFEMVIETLNDMSKAYKSMNEEIEKLVKDNEMLRNRNKELENKMINVKQTLSEIVNSNV